MRGRSVTTNARHLACSQLWLTLRKRRVEWRIFGEGCSARNKGRKGRAMSDMLPAVSRRTFVKATGALGALAAAGGTMAASQAVFSNVEPAHADTPEKLVWSQCNVNCGGRCIFHWHTKDGKIQYMTTDDIGNDDFQARACLRGRVMRQWVNNPGSPPVSDEARRRSPVKESSSASAGMKRSRPLPTRFATPSIPTETIPSM